MKVVLAFFMLPLITLQGVCGQRWSVIYNPESACGYVGSTVDLSCSYTYPSHLKFIQAYWTKHNYTDPPDLSQETEYINRVDVDCSANKCRLRINSLTASDAGVYYCRIITRTAGQKWIGHPGVMLEFLGTPWQGPSVSISPPGKLYEGSDVTLTCHTRAYSSFSSYYPAVTSYSWYKTGSITPLQQDQRKTYTISSITSSEHNGGYYCQIPSECGTLKSDQVDLQVVYVPRHTVALVDPPGQIREGSRVTLTCSTDANPPPHTRWFKRGESTSLWTEKILTFNNIQPENRGQYYCRSVNTIGQQDSPVVSLHVSYGPKNTKVVVDSSDQIREGNKVTLTCSTDANPPPHTYTWYKTDTMIPLQAGENLTFSNIQPENHGDYSCRAVNRIGHQDSPVLSVQVSYKPKKTVIGNSPAGVIHKGGSVSLTCSSDANPPVESYTWFKVNESTPVGSGQQFAISNTRSEDAGQYYCEARNTHGTDNSSPVSITVEGGQSHVTIDVVAVAVCGVICLLGVILFVSTEGGMQSGQDQRGSGQPNVINLNPNTIQPDPVYQSLNPNTIQPDAVYQSLNPNTTQPDAVYQSLNPDTIQPDPVYQSLNPNTTQPTADYENLKPNTTQPDTNAIQPDAVYQSQNPNTT